MDPARAFAQGLASEDATGAIGTAPAPPGETAPARPVFDVLGADGEAFDKQAARARVEAVEHEMLAHGVTPGSALALDLF